MKPHSYLLLPLSWAYGLVTGLRNVLYNRGWKKTFPVGVPVISVGNITAGGTGKTPLAMYLMELLAAKGLKPAYLSRGYGRRTKGFLWVNPEHGTAEKFGDEALQVASRFPALPVAVCEDRVAGARRILAEQGCDVLVLDDAFQHRRIHRDLDIVVADASRMPQRDFLLPAGRLRESLRGLQRAHFMAVSKTGAELPPSPLPENCTGYARLTPVALVHTSARKGKLSPDSLRGIPVFAFCGIGNPEPFRQTLLALGADLRGFRTYPDHHPFTAGELREILNIFTGFSREASSALILTTEKDYHRLRGTPAAELLKDQPVAYLEVGWEWISGGDLLRELIHKQIRKK
jgi:tetraacyldisaccharide 4'-kinase